MVLVSLRGSWELTLVVIVPAVMERKVVDLDNSFQDLISLSTVV